MTTLLAAMTLQRGLAWSVLLHAGAAAAFWTTSAPSPTQATAAQEATPSSPVTTTPTPTPTQPLTRDIPSQRTVDLLQKTVEALTKDFPESQGSALRERVLHDLTPTAQALDLTSSQPGADPAMVAQQTDQLQREAILHVAARHAEQHDADLARHFLAAVDQETAPALAKELKKSVDIQVVRAVDQRIAQAVATQRKEALLALQAAVTSVRQAWHQLRQAEDRLRRQPQDDHGADPLVATAAQQLQEAVAKSHDLDQPQRECLTHATTAVTKAQSTPTPDAIKTAREAANAAIKALSQADHQEDRARQALTAFRQQELRTHAETQLIAQFRATTVPALQPGLLAQAQAAGITDPAQRAQVVATALEHLNARVPALVGIGNQLQGPGSGTGPTTTAAPNPIPTSTPLGQLLTQQCQDLVTTIDRSMATAMQGQTAGQALSSLSRRVTSAAQAPSTQAAERLAQLANGVRQGRSGILAPTDDAASDADQHDATRWVNQGIVQDDQATYRERADRLQQRIRTNGTTWSIESSAAATETHAVAMDTVPATSLWSPPAPARRLGNAAPFQPTFPTLAFTTASWLPPTFRIDGSAGKWAGIPAITLLPEWGTFPTAPTMQLGWRPDGLYLRFHVDDPDRHLTKARPEQFWDSDNVEVWFDGLNTKADYRSRTTGQHFWLWPCGSIDRPDLAGGEARIERKGSPVEVYPLATATVPRVATLDANGWTVESFLPRSVLVEATLAPGRIIGWNAYINTMGGTNWYWSAGKKAKTWYQPDTWGDVLLAGSDGTLELAHPDVPLVPGRPFRVRVRDPDQDVHPDRADIVSVTLTAALGHPMALTLRETGPATGTFEADIATTLALDTPSQEAVVLHAGEPVTITYVDRVGATGTRDQVLQLQLVTASPLATMVRMP